MMIFLSACTTSLNGCFDTLHDVSMACFGCCSSPEKKSFLRFLMKITWKHRIFWRFLTLHFDKINQNSFSCLQQRYMPHIVPKLVPWDSWHHKDHKTYAQCGVKTHIFLSRVKKSALVADTKILFWQTTKCFDMNNCLSKKHFSVSY